MTRAYWQLLLPTLFLAASAANTTTPAAVDTTVTVLTTVTFTATCDDDFPSSTLTSSSIASSTRSQCTPSSTSLPNTKQVGDSKLGSALQQPFPKWIDDTYKSAPWGNRTTSNSDATIYKDVPDTGVTRSYAWTISRGQISPDGVLRDVILINNQFPGPMIEANWGDWVEVTVNNNITSPDEGTAMHWHGMLQRGNQYADGVPGNSQCPLAPGKSQTYRFRAELHGTSWYHAHYSAQYSAGVSGPMIVHGPTSADYDIDLGPVMLTDWAHVPYFSLVSDTVGTDRSLIPPRADSILINGRGTFDCSQPSFSNTTMQLSDGVKSNISWTCVDNAPKSQFTFTKGKTHRLRLVNHGADGFQKFRIDGHKMKVIAIDFVPVKPYEVDLVTLAVGQRADVLVTADQAVGSSWWMRTSTPNWQTCGGSTNPDALAKIYYEGASCDQEPTSTSSVTSNTTDCADNAPSSVQPDYTIDAPPTSAIKNFVLTIEGNATGHGEWKINGQTFKTDYNDPVLLRAAAGQTDFSDEPSWNVYNLGSNSTSVVVNITNNTPFPHPFHLHGHNFFILNQGQGTWDGLIPNAKNPMRRGESWPHVPEHKADHYADVQIIPGSGFVVIQFELDNPGLWPLHCHVAWHLSGGQSVNLLYGSAAIPKVPDAITQTCTDWKAYSSGTVVDQIDSGV